MYEDEAEEDLGTAPTGALGPLGAVAGLAQPLSHDALLAEARKFSDPQAKWRAFSAGAMRPKTGPHFSEAYGNALGAYNQAADREQELVARYLPVVQRTAIARQQQQQQQLQQWHTLMNASMASLLNNPQVGPQQVVANAKALVQQGRVPEEFARNYVKSLPQDPEQLRGYLTQQAIAATDPYRAVKMPEITKLGEGEVAMSRDPVTGEMTQAGAGNPKRTDISRLQGEMDALPPNDPRRAVYENAIKKATTHPPSASMIVNAEKPLVNTFMSSLGEAAGDSRKAASSAVRNLAAIGELRSALSSGRVLTGPLAKQELFLRQIGKSTNFGGGKTNDEILANTRKALQAMAQLELSGAEAMKGQGAITDRERDLIKSAASGEITMTKEEIEAVANALEKVSRGRIKSYNNYAKRLGALEGFEKVAPLLEVEEPPVDEAPTVIYFDAQGNIIDKGR